MKTLKLFLTLSSLLFLFFFYFDILNASSIQTVVQTSREDFSRGSFSESLDIDTVPGMIRMKGEEENVDFSLGYSLLTNALFRNNTIKLNQAFTYSTVSDPVLASNRVNHSFLDPEVGYLYVCTQGGGLSVINTKSNPQTLVTRYHTGSDPALASNLISRSFLDPETGYLYVGTLGGGLSVINTKSTPQTLVTRYHTGSDPALASNIVYHFFLDPDTGYLYISTSIGLSVINTKSTPQTLVTRYHTGSDPALAHNMIRHSFLEPDTGYLYVGTGGGGLSVINTKSTPQTLVTRYHTGSTPELIHDTVYQSFFDTNTEYLYVTTFYGGLSVINTKTSTLVTRYHTGSTPSLASNNVRNFFLDIDTGYLYVGTSVGGLSVINTKENMLVTRYHTGSIPSLASNIISHSFFDLDTGSLYISTNVGLSVINTDNLYTNSGQYYSPYRVGDIPTEQMVLDTTNPANTNATVQYRGTQSQNVWFDDFADASSYIGDFYNWGGGNKFQDVAGIDSILTLSNPTSAYYFYFWFDTGEAANFFPAGSVVQARIKMNINSVVQEYYECYMISDQQEFEFPDVTFNEWVYLSWVPGSPFSELGFYLEFGDNLGPLDSFEVDWLRITSPDSAWSEWSEPCNSVYGCNIDTTGLSDDDWLQFRLNLSTSDRNVTPMVNSLKLLGDFSSSGEYISSVIDSGRINTVWSSLNFEGYNPTTNSLILYTRTGNTPAPDSSWSSWSLVNSPITSPPGRYLQYMVLFSNLVSGEAPVLGAVSVSYIEDIESTLPTELLNDELPATGMNILTVLMLSSTGALFTGKSLLNIQRKKSVKSP